MEAEHNRQLLVERKLKYCEQEKEVRKWRGE
jgi:hypothetical protein